jgi:hypothetical protein
LAVAAGLFVDGLEAAGATALVEAAAAELSAENELPVPSCWLAAAAIAAGAVLTYAMYLSWWKAADPNGFGHNGQSQWAAGIRRRVHGYTLT